MDSQEKLYQIALLRTPGIGSTNIKSLISYCGSAKNVFDATKGKLSKIPGIGMITANALKSEYPDLEAAQMELDRVAKHKAQLLFYTDKEYPQRLKQIPDAPPLIYIQGKGDLEAGKTVAVVGTRKATNYGKGFVNELVEGLVSHNATVISGLAYGIDITAHKAALKNNLPTIGVMASGLDIIYPAAHRQTAMDMLDYGALITENPFGTKPDAPRFPARNRIIAGLADAVIVIEAAKKGGALITAEIANSYNKDVFALPGSVGISSSEGCNMLIKSNRAHLLEKVQDIEYIMNWDFQTKKVTNTPPLDLSQLDGKEKAIVSLFISANGNALLIDDISWKSQIPIAEIASLLLQLEFKGVLQSLPGKRYKLLH